MQLDSMMRGGCNNGIILRGMDNKFSNSFLKKRNVADGNKKES